MLVALHGGDVVYWLFSDDGSFVSVNPETDEMVDFWVAGEEVERDEEEPDVVGYQGDSYELSYEDKGTVTAIVGEVPVEENETYLFKDFENGEIEFLSSLARPSSGRGRGWIPDRTIPE